MTRAERRELWEARIAEFKASGQSVAAGAKASATIYSIIESAKENNLNPYAYLNYLFEKLPNVDITDKETLDTFLPWSDALPAECRVQK